MKVSETDKPEEPESPVTDSGFFVSAKDLMENDGAGEQDIWRPVALKSDDKVPAAGNGDIDRALF